MRPRWIAILIVILACPALAQEEHASAHHRAEKLAAQLSEGEAPAHSESVHMEEAKAAHEEPAAPTSIEPEPKAEEHEAVAEAAPVARKSKRSWMPKVQWNWTKLQRLVPPGFMAIYDQFWVKVDQLQNLDSENESLRQRMAILEITNAELTQKKNTECRDKPRAESMKEQAKAEGGHVAARTLASVDLKETEFKEMLSKPPRVIFDQSLKAFLAAQYEVSAKGFAQLADNKENDAYQTARVFYLAGVSLYRIGDYKKAQSFLREAVAKAQGSEVSYGPRSLAWIALCQGRLGDKAGEKQTVFELLQKFPKSKEARRLNRRG